MVVTLIGYRGSGKTTVGKQLAVRLGWSCVDSDHEIEQQAGQSISAIFAELGEPHFRDLERGVLRELLGRHAIVISAGGGSILDDSIRQEMREAGPVVWLEAPVETLVARISGDESTAQRRPSLSGADPHAEVAAVLADRQHLYQDAATHRVQTENRDIPGIVDEIVSYLPFEPGAGT